MISALRRVDTHVNCLQAVSEHEDKKIIMNISREQITESVWLCKESCMNEILLAEIKAKRSTTDLFKNVFEGGVLQQTKIRLSSSLNFK